MTLAGFLEQAERELSVAGVPEARADAEWLAEHVTGIRRLEIPLFLSRQLAGEEARCLAGFVARRRRREPLQHLIGWVPFLGWEIEVGRAAFIPRPETEVLAERAVRRLERRGGVCKVLDLGTGTGCVAVAVAEAVAGAVCWAVDCSPEALALAKRNVARHGLEQRVYLVKSDWFSQLEPSLSFDLIISNPPYIPRSAIAGLLPEVRDYDPRLALDGGAEGLDVYAVIAAEGRRFLSADGGAVVEFGDGQGGKVREMFKAAGWKLAGMYRDVGGKERVLECDAG